MNITDPNGIYVTVNNEKWFKYFADFQHDGKTFSFDFYARDNDEAIEMLRSIRTTAIECNQISGEIPAYPGVGIWIKTLCWWRNLLSF